MGIQRQEQWLARTSVLWKESENSDGQLGQCPKARSLVWDSTILTTIYCDAVDQEFDTNKSDNISETTCPVNCLFSLLP